MKNDQGITPEVGKRYVTRGGWVTPPIKDYKDGFYACTYNAEEDPDTYFSNEDGSEFQIIAEYVEPTKTILQREYVDTPDTFRRDLIARIYVGMIGGAFAAGRVVYRDKFIHEAILSADTLIQAQEAAK